MTEKILLFEREGDDLRRLHTVLSECFEVTDIQPTDNFAMAMHMAVSMMFAIAVINIDFCARREAELLERLRKFNPNINIIFTCDRPASAGRTLSMHASGYLVKPYDRADIEREIGELRFPVQETAAAPVRNAPKLSEKDETVAPGKLFFRCFGKFEVFCDGQLIHFKRSAEKEILAYLVSLKGCGANTDEICGVLWEDYEQRDRRKGYFRVLMSDLSRTLEEYGGGDILVHSRNYFAVNTRVMNCDYYRYLDGNPNYAGLYRGEYMSQYSWAEMTNAYLASREEHR